MAGVLAFDLGSTTGWAYVGGADAAPEFGHFTLPRAMGRRLAPVFSTFFDRVFVIINERRPRSVWYEATLPRRAHRSEAAAIKAYGMAAIVLTVCGMFGIDDVRTVHNATVKLHMTGSGRADKPMMHAAACRLGWEPKDPNEADALGVLSYAVSVCAPDIGRRWLERSMGAR